MCGRFAAQQPRYISLLPRAHFCDPFSSLLFFVTLYFVVPLRSYLAHHPLFGLASRAPNLDPTPVDHPIPPTSPYSILTPHTPHPPGTARALRVYTLRTILRSLSFRSLRRPRCLSLLDLEYLPIEDPAHTISPLQSRPSPCSGRTTFRSTQGNISVSWLTTA